ncbi:MAG: cytochrome c biogenesis protein CcdA [Aquiluna sp.]
MAVGEVIFSGSLLAAIPLALIAGLVAFASPCVLPLVPAYLGYVSGMSSLPTKDDADARRRLLAGVILFVIGFAAVFVLFSVAFASLGALLRTWLPLVTQIAGAVVIVMGFVFIGQVSFMQKQIALPLRAATGVGGAPLLGVIFGFGWAPCVGPTLVAVNTLALSVGDIPRAVILALAYSLGLGVPFVVIAMGLQFATKSMGFVKQHLRTINIAGGAFLMAIGVAMVFGWWTAWMSQLQVWISGSLTVL